LFSQSAFFKKMAKNIVICCDGTANEFATHHTNVLKLYRMLEQTPGIQVAYYHPGLGTAEPEGSLSPLTRKLTRLAGRAFGFGLASDVASAYRFLMQNYERGDVVYLFGFSRGAYTGRAVAALVHAFGILRRGNEPLVPYATRMLLGMSRALDHRPSSKSRVFRMADDFRETFSFAKCKIHFVGLWDTVNSIGWIANPLRLPYIANNPDVEIGRHALSLDERRAFFRTHLWQPSETDAGQEGQSGPRNLQQVWFAGVHCDVGGGYPEGESGLSKIALEWMVEEARIAGLLINSEKQSRILGRSGSDEFAQPDEKGIRHESLRWWWHLAEFVPKRSFDWKDRKWRWRCNLYRPRMLPPKALVHESVYRRGGYESRIPSDAIRVSTQSLPRTDGHSVGWKI